MASACFPGCVQLLANIFSLKTSGSSSNGNGNDGGDGAEDGGDGADDGGDGDGSLTAAKGLASWAAGDSASAAVGGSSSDLAAAVLSNVCGELLSLGEGAPDVDVAVGAAAAITKGGGDTAATAADAAADVSSSSSSKINPEFPAVSLQCFEPACLTAGEPQQQLTLQLPAVQGGDADAPGEYDGAVCRLVAFQDGEVVVDQEVTLQGNSIR
jgi:hypothetical protein